MNILDIGFGSLVFDFFSLKRSGESKRNRSKEPRPKTKDQRPIKENVFRRSLLPKVPGLESAGAGILHALRHEANDNRRTAGGALRCG
jgi:hypothetical protein